MTRLGKPVQRTIDLAGTEIVVRVASEGVTFREKGRRTWYGTLPWQALFSQSLKIRVMELVEKRPQRRSVRRKLRTR